MNANPEIFLAVANWTSHSDLDNFDSDKLVEALASPGQDGRPFLWTEEFQTSWKIYGSFLHKLKIQEHTDQTVIIDFGQVIADFFSMNPHGRIVRNMVRQAEAVFNLSQLMFALYHGDEKALTFRDLNDPNRQHHHRNITNWGFTKRLDHVEDEEGNPHRRALHDLCCDIFEAGGHEVIFTMFRNDHMKIIKQKCLDALTNILCVPVIEEYVLREHEWFLIELVKLIKTGRSNEKLQQTVVPSISVLDRLVVVILSNKMERQYDTVMREECIESCLHLLENGTDEHQIKPKNAKYNFDNRKSAFTQTRPHFAKFETISMQAISLLFLDDRSSKWHKKLLRRICTHSLRNVYKWTDKRANEENRNNLDSSTLLFTLSIIVKALSIKDLSEYIRKWLTEGNLILRIIKNTTEIKSDQNGKHLIIADIWAPPQRSIEHGRAIVNALTYVYHKCYPDSRLPEPYQDKLPGSITDPLAELSENVYRRCSNKTCQRRERPDNRFEIKCRRCGVTLYCSDKCRNKDTTHSPICKFLRKENPGKPFTRLDAHNSRKRKFGNSIKNVLGL